MYNVALNFEDGVTRFIQCNDNEKVLDAAYRQKINLPMDCSDGVCGTCKCHCESGEFDLGDEYIDEALSDQERAKGMVLTCQMVPTSDCVIQIPMASTLCKTGDQQFTASIGRVASLSDSAIELELNLTSHPGITFLPGQYINIQVPGSDAWRAYSFSSKPGSAQLSFLLRNVPDGRMSTWLTQSAREGDVMQLAGPLGSFYLRPVQRPVVMLAGGTGLAPFLSMLEQLAVTGCDKPITLLYGVNRDEDRVKLEQLEGLAARLPGFSYRVCVADPGTTNPYQGYVTDHMSRDTLHDGEVDIYLCGPPPMVDAVMSWLEVARIEPAHFYYEKFAPQR
ncbi:benzoate 1,2-dioxygenase electron transfer component BenC [Shimwellia blattae]|uniref:Benzoate 1,2-dioxygenase electron transfer component n=1 Tax=Shimwellia blattae (strain ATCC 29907 / DSM 4481 / JCM 1650 / NBRC 105725 / CDC 9005-74) TaxID=630626 RepID=I2B8Q5_SHIBC|nr:benzoate 1,2-dioxygenase electron transfer component BenC [Shimwellia blattae]AFJ46909.1 benzoate 1,2-dioxygenase electron transfer component [Shimwellia blattae DSM 4481 = NBRC 105725]GAB82430.1 putative NADH oxidoreductase [Shimwellia blattae DSM 4481 = NBRC 105725]VDY64397.1 Benzoate 1,2-dioxygenase electron transfer component [Shimwellia blattae]VEC22511.1 Benzoate 1,2-dioxygenase electron transfer component [Shimwellia blattae]